ncbi:MAG: hypothetical protein ACTHL8_05395 [Burkholderiaceae bacterium]
MPDTILTAPLAAAQTNLPAARRMHLILPTATAGAIRFSGVLGWSGGGSFVVPAGTSGLVVLPFGASDHVITAGLDNPADQSIGALVALRVDPAAPVLTDDPTGVLPLKPARPTLSPGFALREQRGQVGPRAFTAGFVAICGAPLVGSLTLSAAGGFAQTLAAGSTGLIALSGPTGAPLTYAFSMPSDAPAADVIVVGQFA